ncbi:DinB family protein [Flavobacterium phragmitis]|uniref:DinB superfamily protein n=1 Tax=Flavobacterium phragmitis TaxID=739143 RepID=A0A1I1RTP1_9FLAO|nr:DinB family protein [Flavobacterium phragmitis]SFD35608.1 DinB superfamily protein [Flavobacterium phragmitis]
MSSVFETQKTIREILLKILESHSLEQLNKIPQGFNNNIIWNVAHCVAAQQTLVYKLSGLPTMVSEEFVNKYRKGTKPEGDVSQAEVDEVKAFLLSTLEKTKNDFTSGLFVDYHEYTTSMGFTLSNVQDALDFNNYHEGIHTGMAMTLRKLV